MKKFLRKIKRKHLVIGGIVLIVLIILTLSIVVINKNRVKNTINEYNNIMMELGKIFYEDQYYDIILGSHRKEYLSAFKDNGVVVDLNTLSNVSTKTRELSKKLINVDTKESCDKTNTKVIIKTKEPYDKTDYTIEVKLDCGFNN